MPTNKDLVESLQRLVGADLPAFLSALQEAPLSGLRANTLKIDPAALKDLVPGLALRPVPWCPAGFVIDEAAVSPGKHPLHAAGLYYLQEPSAMLPAAWLAPRPGARVLDLCAAPGGKATHLASLLGDQGLLVANETVPARAAILAENLERWGARHTIISNETPERLAAAWPGSFDYVLVDAPCSGEGMLRKLQAAGTPLEWSPAQVLGCARRQQTILEAAAQLVTPGGHLVYSTCTFNATENEQVVAEFLSGHADFALAAGPDLPGLAPAVEPLAGHAGLARLWPHRAAAEGHFVARLQRRYDSPLPNETAADSPPAGDAALQAWTRFCDEALLVAPQGRSVQTGTYLYRLPAAAPDLHGLRVLRPGWWLGEVRGSRFLPSHALALGLQAHDFQRSLDLASGDPQVLAYLRGESLRMAGPDGWLAVTVEGFPVGWGKRSRGTVKNHYPKGLRWRLGTS